MDRSSTNAIFMRPVAMLTGMLLLSVSLGGAVGSVQPTSDDLAGDERHQVECTDEFGRIKVPDGLVIGGPQDNRDREPYQSWWATCGFYTGTEQVTLWINYDEILADVKQCRQDFDEMLAESNEPSWVKEMYDVQEYCGTPPPASDVLPNGTIALDVDMVTISLAPGTAFGDDHESVSFDDALRNSEGDAKDQD